MPLFGSGPARWVTPPAEPTATQRLAQRVAAIDLALAAQAELPPAERDGSLVDTLLDRRLITHPVREGLSVPVTPGRAA